MDTGGELGISESQSRNRKGHMTNTHIKDSDEEAIVDFVKHQGELYNKTNEHFKDKARKNICWRRSPTAAICMSKCGRLDLNPKQLTMKRSPSSSLARLTGK